MTTNSIISELIVFFKSEYDSLNIQVYMARFFRKKCTKINALNDFFNAIVIIFKCL